MIEPLRTIIVDDEEGAHLVIGHHLQGMKTLDLCGDFYNALDAMNYIYTHPVDLVFLDINMPGLSGLEMLQSMKNPPLVVLTTAYAEFALESYKYEVVDYLVKPIEFPRFVSAVDKVLSRFRPLTTSAISDLQNKPDHLMLKVEGNILKVMLKDILFIQSWGNYVKIHTTDATHLSLMTTSEIEQKLDKSKFIRIHKSYIVAIEHVQKISGGELHLNGNHVLPIGNTFRRELMEFFQ